MSKYYRKKYRKKYKSREERGISKEEWYKPFKKSLKMYINTWDFETREELKRLMTNAGFRVGKEGAREVSNKQVDTAWDMMYDLGYFDKQKRLKFEINLDYIKHEYTYYGKSRDVYRAKRYVTINNKRYRPGQFIPKVR